MKTTKRKRRNKILANLSLLIFVAGIAIIFYYLSAPSLVNSPKLGTTDLKRDALENKNLGESRAPELTEDKIDKTSEKLHKSLVLTELAGGTTNLSFYDFSAGKPILFFTDSDEKYKIKTLVGKDRNQNIIAIVGDNNFKSNAGKLAKISSDGKAKISIIQDSFGSDIAPALSPDGQKIAYVVFSNAERDYGFSLFQSSLNGDNQVLIDKSSLGYLDIDYASKGKILLAIRKTADNTSELVSFDTQQGKSDVIYEPKTDLRFVSAYDGGVAVANGNSVVILEGKSKTIPSRAKILALSASQGYVIWLTKEEEENIYVYNTSTKITKTYTGAGNSLIAK